ncbi:MAG: right-handed parallel beta-helix repeat-containing protein [Planctomyces sp.]|nr:right-handed parallel beta-helix repeat-containing protein [Planctomyces sp.]
MAFTEFCCKTAGNNLNAGSVDGGSTEPGTSPLLTVTGCTWNGGTGVITVPAGPAFTEIQVGRFISVCADGATVPSANGLVIARITAVDSGARTITTSTTARWQQGTLLSNGTSNRTIRIGGAWAFLSGATTDGGVFSNGTTSGLETLTNAGGDPIRINVKNDGTYSPTGALGLTSAGGSLVLEGYTTTYGDGGRPLIQGPTTGASITVFTVSMNDVFVRNFEFANNGATGTAFMVNSNSVRAIWGRCVFRDARGHGIIFNSQGTIEDSEAFGNNAGNQANGSGIGINSGGTVVRRCIAHHNLGGTSGAGFRFGQTGFLEDCIAWANGLYGVSLAQTQLLIRRCDIYDNPGAGLAITGGTRQTLLIENSSFVKNGGGGLNGSAQSNPIYGFARNCAFGAGAMANAGGDIISMQGLVLENKVTLPANQTPWNDPNNGDFRLVHADAIGAGWGGFLMTHSGYGPATSFADIGALRRTTVQSGGGGGNVIVIED